MMCYNKEMNLIGCDMRQLIFGCVMIGLNGCGFGLQSFEAGEGEGGLLSIEPAEPISFGNITVGTYEKQEIRLVAEGNVAVEDVYLDGDSVFRFEADPPVPKVLEDQAVLPIKIIFEPENTQAYNATLVVFSGGFELERRVQGVGE